MVRSMKAAKKRLKPAVAGISDDFTVWKYDLIE
jgi:hypothetical protein